MDSAFIKANASMESLHSPTDPEARISTKPGKPRNLIKNARTDSKGYTRHCYRSSESVCKNREHKTACCGEKTNFKKTERSEHHDLYMKNHEKRTRNERYAARMSCLRSATVEPVLGTLINFMGMKRVNTKGISGAEKHVLMAAMCYNLQKLLRFRKLNTVAIAIKKQADTDIFTGKFLVCFSPVFARFQPK